MESVHDGKDLSDHSISHKEEVILNQFMKERRLSNVILAMQGLLKSNLWSIETFHEENNSFKFNVCDGTFSQRGNLNCHIESQTLHLNDFFPLWTVSICPFRNLQGFLSSWTCFISVMIQGLWQTGPKWPWWPLINWWIRICQIWKTISFFCEFEII